MNPLTGLLMAGTSLASGLLSKSAQEEANATSERNALRNIELQKQFAQEGIRWKVADAQAAGIHPLYALGASTTSFAPVSVGVTPTTGLATGLAAAGQDLGRAINATRTSAERDEAYASTVKALTLQRMGLENEVLGSQIRKLNQAGTPPAAPVANASSPDPALSFPSTVFSSPKEDDVQERPQLGMFGRKWFTYPGSANAEEFEKRYGDVGEEIAGVLNGLQDLGYNISKTDAWRVLAAAYDRRAETAQHARWMREVDRGRYKGHTLGFGGMGPR